jgi:hypothetical protein
MKHIYTGKSDGNKMYTSFKNIIFMVYLKVQCFFHPAYSTIVEALGKESAVEERLEDT